MGRWFRVHDDLVDDPKVQLLSGDLVKALLNLWCLASQNDGVLPAMSAMAFKLRMKPQQVAVVIAELSNAGLIDRDGDEYRPHNWDKRQYKSDTDKTAADRAKRYRAKNRDANVSVTRDADRDANALRERPETEADTEQKQITEPIGSGAEAPPIDPSQAERDYFARGRDVLGKSAGGQLAKLLKLNGGNVALSRSTLELAATKHDKAAFFARAISRQSQGPPAGKGGFVSVLMDRHRERQDGTASDFEAKHDERGFASG
ncbi:hypothetical protein V1290_000032 [Bradyrhizobium sp. AZCC 1578]|uniref:hypothetical protein n=1 Tax=Bradyrhizobium sp. AZCC 1578 TaxID=3117027 RepID=UPI002FF1195F